MTPADTTTPAAPSPAAPSASVPAASVPAAATVPAATVPTTATPLAPALHGANAQAAGLAILLWASEPASPHRLATPFFHAAAAAAFDLTVEIYFSARSVLLLQPGVAAGLYASNHPASNILAALQTAVGQGAILFACSDALQAHGLAASPLIPECIRRGGAVQFMARATDLRWRTLVF